LVREVPANSSAKAFVRLADIDRLAVIVEERVDAPSVVPDRRSNSGGVMLEGLIKKSGEMLPQIRCLERRNADGIRSGSEERRTPIGHGATA
jgi:hypothetical protein